MSLSDRSREVFGQLSIVTAIIFALLYNDKKVAGKWSKKLTYILSAEAFFLILMAGKSVFDYINAWGFTYKRLYGVTVVLFLFITFFLFIKNYLQTKDQEDLATKVVAVFGLFLIAVNIFNFDYLIYHYKKSSTGQGVDYSYLAGLSSDSLSYKEQLNDLEKTYSSSANKDEFLRSSMPWKLFWRIQNLQSKYVNFDLRTFSLMEYMQYQRIKDIHLPDYYGKYSNPDLPPQFIY